MCRELQGNADGESPNGCQGIPHKTRTPSHRQHAPDVHHVESHRETGTTECETALEQHDRRYGALTFRATSHAPFHGVVPGGSNEFHAVLTSLVRVYASPALVLVSRAFDFASAI